MQFFFLDFALALIALLGYRALAAVTRDRLSAVLLGGSLRAPSANNPGMARPTRRSRPGDVLPRRRPLRDEPPSCESGDGTTCGERPPHRLINFW